MRKTENQSINKIKDLWKNVKSYKFDKIKDKNTAETNKDRDASSTDSPISCLNFNGLTREQAKAEIDKLIDEKLEKVSHLELGELKIDYKEKEKLRAEAEARIKERRNKRKERGHVAAETVITHDGVYSDFKSGSVFDFISPEEFPVDETVSEPLEGQLSITEVLKESQKLETPEKINRADEKANISLEKINIVPEKEGKPEIQISTKIDETIDKVFVFFGRRRDFAVKYSFAAKAKCQTLYAAKLSPAYKKSLKIMGAKVIPVLYKIDCKIKLREKIAGLIIGLYEREKKNSEKMAALVVATDEKIDKLINFTNAKWSLFNHKFDQMREYAEHNKRKIIIRAGISVAAIAVVMVAVGSMTAYEYVYNGKVLGVVKNQNDVYKTIDIIGNKLSYEYDAEITIDKEKDIRFNKIMVLGREVDNEEDVLNRLTYMRNMKANGHGIYVEGKLVAILESKEKANEILAAIQNQYLTNNINIQYKSVGFAQKVQIKDIETKLGNILKEEKALEYMMTGATEKKIHYVQSGETFSEIAKMYGMKQSELSVANPAVIPAKLKIGQEICLNQIVPVVTVQTVEVAQYNEVMPYGIAYENTASLYKNEQTVKARGANGERQVVAEITRNNGIETSKKEISSVILSQPVSQVVLIGTKEPPPLIGTGNLIYPIRGKLTSRYGSRWGRLHSGIDLAAPSGTRIGAADGGKVIFAGYNGSLGYMVKIDHGGGKVTLYGHCSKLFVKSGQRVYQGQHIANVGSTGRSTGPHVHFEVHVNGKTKNPLSYL